MPEVLNMKRDPTVGTRPNTRYIGRPTQWGNPFVIGIDGTRNTVIDKFEKMVLENPEFQKLIQKELKGMDLICYCKPKRCHGDILLKIANSPFTVAVANLQIKVDEVKNG